MDEAAVTRPFTCSGAHTSWIRHTSRSPLLSLQEVDLTVYNCVLDVCVCAGELARARALVGEMRETGPLDTVTYNTLLKGYCAKGDLESARAVLHEMEPLPAHSAPSRCVFFGCAPGRELKGIHI